MKADLKTHAIQPVQIRDILLPTDPAAIARIVASTGFFSAAEQRIAVELATERLAQGDASTYRFLLADAGEQIAGYSCYGHVDSTQSSFDLYWIAVAPEHQGKRIGHSLIAHTESRIRDLGGTGVYVETSSRELYRPTHAFYEACGYELAARLPSFYAPDDDKLIFFKALPV